MKILLFDMDGVLVEPHGYHRALQETVRLIARSLGYAEVRLTSQDIAAFESAGVASEWDTAAICTAMLLDQAWTVDPEITLSLEVKEVRAISKGTTAPDFNMLATQLNRQEYLDLRPLQRAESWFLNHSNQRTPLQSATLKSILQHARAHYHSLTHRIFQELVLGSQIYANSYDLPPQLDSQSYLLTYDRSNLSPSQTALLLDWLEAPENQAAIFTGRPSSPLPGAFSTPEAELGASLVGLENLPILGLGGLLWLAEQQNQNHQTYLKPSPIHVLAALQLCLGAPPELALTLASQLSQDQAFHPSWLLLKGAQVSVFEDTVAGLESARAAQIILISLGIDIDLHLYGIAASQAKAQALANAGARTFNSLWNSLGPAWRGSQRNTFD